MAFRTHLAGGISAVAVVTALAAAAAPAYAQEATVQPPTPVDEDGAEGQPVDPDSSDTIIVTGFRRSLETAVAEKRNSDQILESVTAEDIGKLPDNSIGESIARLPGVTSQRANGRSNVIAIRGLGPDFSQTLLNGREQTSTGDARAVEFDQYPAEVVNQVVVYKTPTAELVGQGLIGTIDVRTIRPLEAGERVFAIGARGSYADLGKLNAGSEELGYRLNAAYVDQFADDTLGVSLAASYTDEPYQVQEFNAWGYTNAPTGGPQLIGGSKSYVTSTQLKRFGAAGTVQWEPAPEWTVTLDGFYSDFDDEQIKRGVELPLGFAVRGDDPDTDVDERIEPGFSNATFDPSSAVVENDTVVAGRFPSVEGVVRNDQFNKEAQLFSGGLNVLYEGDDGWSAYADFGYSRTDRRELSFESYAGTGYGAQNGATDDISFTLDESGAFFSSTLDYSDPTQIFLTDPLGWGGDTRQAGYFNDRIVDDELKQYRVHIEKEIYDSFLSAVIFGLNYTDRDKSLTPDESFIVLSGDRLEAPIPESALLRPTNLDYLGLGPIVSYDARDLIADGTYVLQPNTSQDVPAKAYQISEDLMTAYLQANIMQDFGAAELTGNIGVQAISTVQKSSGLIFVDGVGSQRTRGASYWDVLPSLNLSLRFDSDFVVRFSAAREIQRPRLDDLRVALGYGLDQTNEAQSPTGIVPFISGGGGNPELRPFRANAVDLTLEKYFGRDGGVIAIQAFYKDIVSYIDSAPFTFDYTGFPFPAGSPAGLSPIGLLNAPQNTGGGDFYGIETAITLPFNIFSETLDGFGVTGGVGYTETKIEDAFGNIDQIPGYSKWVANGTAYFEKWGFNARGSVRYRSSFLGDFTGFGGSPTRRLARDETIVDAQIGYDFQDGSALEGLSLYVQGQNLTDQPFASINGNGNQLQVVDYQIYGRRFLAGFTYKF
ncbi:TonB-dependent receptor [Erythrobacter litoralis]|uniref:TonB-dependent receptor n=1 Tax=Erythrobacter litoralis TaxID=39960 RepID=UPI0024358108|nr:TonB-dependent receptor [Erythrobacter litoralis]MDG6077619.1 TonB-dependent receptor [Erythrobacter litoralis]